MRIKLKATAAMGGQNTPGWYRHETDQLAGVTNLPANVDLGLEGTLIFPPTQAQEESGMVCVVILKTIVGDIRATIYESKNNPGTLYLRPPQSREEKEDGEVVYHDEVKMPNKLIAQVLRYIETQVIMETQAPADLNALLSMSNGLNLGGTLDPSILAQQQALAQQALIAQQAMQMQQQAGAGATLPQAQTQPQPNPAVSVDEDPFANHQTPQA